MLRVAFIDFLLRRFFFVEKRLGTITREYKQYFLKKYFIKFEIKNVELSYNLIQKRLTKYWVRGKPVFKEI